MILIITNSGREASLLTALCDHRTWPAQSCGTMGEFIKLAERNPPRVVVVRHRIGDGHSDDLFQWLRTSFSGAAPRVIVLVAADCTIQREARQIALGADLVLRDPLRLEVLLEYLAKYRLAGGQPVLLIPPPLAYDFAGVRVVPHEHRLEKAGRIVHVAPQVIALLRVLHLSMGKVTPYPQLFCELFNQRFAGDTSNCRVLLAKTVASFAQLKVDLRTHIKVIPKSGYLYEAKVPPETGPNRPRK